LRPGGAATSVPGVARSLADFVRWLDGLTRPAELPALTRELGELTLTSDDVRGHVRFTSGSYARNLVHAGRHHHLLVLCWNNGQRSPIHDHRGSVCGVRVLHGTMTETFFERAPNHHIKAISSHDVGPGEVVGGADSDIHQISNLQPANAELVTLHVYSPPLLTMGTYTLFDTRRAEEPMFLEFYDAGGI
jgi:cysteine dioxygenase